MKKLSTADEQKKIMANNLQSLLDIKRKNATDVARELGLPETTVRSWFSGEKYPRLDKIQMLSDYFNVPRSRITEDQNSLQEVTSLTKIPVLGTIACGEPITADENIEEYMDEISDLLPTGKLFYLKTKGNSMNPTIPSGSYVLIREQPEVEDGEIAAVLVNGDSEATLKRVKRQGNIVLLVPDNPEFHPYVVTEDNPARILGKALKFTTNL